MSSKRKSGKGKPKSKGGAGAGRNTAGRKTAARMDLKPNSAAQAAPQPPKSAPPKPEAPEPASSGQTPPKQEPKTGPATEPKIGAKTGASQAQYRRAEPAAEGGAPQTGRTGGLTWVTALGLILLGAGALFVYAQMHTSPCGQPQSGVQTGAPEGAARECAHSWFSWSRNETAVRP